MCVWEIGWLCWCFSEGFFPLSVLLKKTVKSPLVGSIGGSFYDFSPTACDGSNELKKKNVRKVNKAILDLVDGRGRGCSFTLSVNALWSRMQAGRQDWGSCMNNSAALPQSALDSHPPPQHPRSRGPTVGLHNSSARAAFTGLSENQRWPWANHSHYLSMGWIREKKTKSSTECL